MATSFLNPLLEFNFDQRGNAVKSWTIQNDNVMGGVSEGSVQWQEEGLRWFGHTRLENNGGFSSIRSPWKAFDLTEFKAVSIRCKGTGGPFKIVLDTQYAWYSVARVRVVPSKLYWTPNMLGTCPMRKPTSTSAKNGATW